MKDPVKVSGKLQKQDITIADWTCSKVDAVEADVRQMAEGKSYRLSSVVARSCQGSNYLSMPKEGASLAELPDIGDVAEVDVGELCTTIVDAEVAGIISLGLYSACIACRSKVTATTNKLGQCMKCNMLQKCKKQLSANLLIWHCSASQFLTLQAFGTNVSDIAQSKDVTAELLLEAPPFIYPYI